jgi:hypothetical protein
MSQEASAELLLGVHEKKDKRMWSYLHLVESHTKQEPDGAWKSASCAWTPGKTEMLSVLSAIRTIREQ